MTTLTKTTPHLDRAAAVAIAALRRLADAGITVEGSGPPYLVAGIFRFFPAAGLFRSIDGRMQGYGVGNLIAAARVADSARRMTAARAPAGEQFLRRVKGEA